MNQKFEKTARELKANLALECELWELEEALKKFDMNQNEAVDYVMRMNQAERDVLAAGALCPFPLPTCSDFVGPILTFHLQVAGFPTRKHRKTRRRTNRR